MAYAAYNLIHFDYFLSSFCDCNFLCFVIFNNMMHNSSESEHVPS